MELAHFRRIAEPHPKAVRWNVEPPMPLGNIYRSLDRGAKARVEAWHFQARAP